MKQMAILGTLGILMLALTLTPSARGAVAQNQDIVGDWRLERVGGPVAPAERPRGGITSSVLSLSRDKDGKLTGQMIGMMGITDLNDVKYENGTLSFSQTARMRQEETVTRFTGTLRDGKLVGTQSSQRGEVQMQGTPMMTSLDIVGLWEITTTRGDREMVTMLSVMPDEDGNITAAWQPRRGQGFGERPEGQQGQRGQGERPQGQRERPEGQRGQGGQGGERPTQGERAAGQRPAGTGAGAGVAGLSDVEYKNGVLTFSRRMAGRGQQDGQQPERVTRYSLRARGDVLTGTVTTPQGEQSITGKRADSPLVGKWVLTVQAERGGRTQRLVVFPDMSGLYGPTAVDAISLENDNVGFTVSMGFGERTFDSVFRGKLDGEKLTGQMTMSGFDGQRVTQEVVGKKM